MKNITEDHIALLKQHNQTEGKEVFSEDDLVSLKAGDAPFRVQGKADKVLEDYQKKMKMPLSREMSFRLFPTRPEMQQGFNQIGSDMFPVLNEYIVLREILVSKGIVTNEEIEAVLEKKGQEMAAAVKQEEETVTNEKQDEKS